MFTTALNDQVTVLHPCRGVKTPTVPTKPLRIVTPDEFDAFYRGLPDDLARLMVEVDIDSGTRWGELTELRVRDFDFSNHVVIVSRAVVEVNPKFHPVVTAARSAPVITIRNGPDAMADASPFLHQVRLRTDQL